MAKKSMFNLLSPIIAVMFMVLYWMDSAIFGRVLGEYNPFLVFGFAIFVGSLSNIVIKTNYGKQHRDISEGIRSSTLVAVVFGGIIILYDLLFPFPIDTNVLFPSSLLYYPVFGYLVETVLHLFPIMILSKMNVKPQWLYLVSFIEPVIQQGLGGLGEKPGLVFMHIWMINVYQIRAFNRHGFFSMYFLRIVYYAIWHLIWGSIRLDILF